MAKSRQPTRFTVEGSGVFPFDMLRYDQCWPVDPNDAAKMEEHYMERRRVVLYTNSPFAPTAGRWGSFLWRVVKD